MTLLVKDFIFKSEVPGDIAVELEVEATHSLPQIFNETWVTKRETSLRGIGMEYVAKAPWSRNDKKKALASLLSELDKTSYGVIKDSYRTSFHVHLNVMKLTLVQYWTVVVAYWIVENLLFKYCSPTRKGNHFCLRLTDAEGVLKYVVRDLKSAHPFQQFYADEIRYSGLNLVATPQFGSLEARGMDGYIDLKKYDIWSDELLNLRDNVVKRYTSPSHLMDSFFKMEPRAFLETLFSREFVEILTSYRDWQGYLDDNLGSLSEVAYFHTWDMWASKLVAPKKTQLSDLDRSYEDSLARLDRIREAVASNRRRRDIPAASPVESDALNEPSQSSSSSVLWDTITNTTPINVTMNPGTINTARW